MGPNKTVDTERLARLQSELIAIDVWDMACYRSQLRDDIDEMSYCHRQERRVKILGEIRSMMDMMPDLSD